MRGLESGTYPTLLNFLSPVSHVEASANFSRSSCSSKSYSTTVTDGWPARMRVSLSGQLLATRRSRAPAVSSPSAATGLVLPPAPDSAPAPLVSSAATGL